MKLVVQCNMLYRREPVLKIFKITLLIDRKIPDRIIIVHKSDATFSLLGVKNINYSQIG